jgi:hypothetical protein
MPTLTSSASTQSRSPSRTNPSESYSLGIRDVFNDVGGIFGTEQTEQID